MDIQSFSEGLQKRLKETESLAGTNDLVKAGKALTYLRDIMDDLKRFTLKYAFKDTREEVMFFKEIKPVLLSQYFYYKKMFALLLFDSFRDKKSRVDNYRSVLLKLEVYARKNKEFYEYCMSGATYLDTHYFTRNPQNLPRVNVDENFSTGYDTKLSKILAHELMKVFVLDALRKLQEDKGESTSMRLPWTDTKVALIEMIYALHAAGVFNHGRMDIKQIVQSFEELFAVDLGNYARVFSEIRIRKSGQTNFMGHLKDKLSQYISDLN